MLSSSFVLEATKERSESPELDPFAAPFVGLNDDRLRDFVVLVVADERETSIVEVLLLKATKEFSEFGLVVVPVVGAHDERLLDFLVLVGVDEWVISIVEELPLLVTESEVDLVKQILS